MNTILPWVAVVDDEAAIRRALLRLLRSAAIPARDFATGREFLDALSGAHPYCVVLDMHMPDMNGFDIHTRLAALAPAIGVIVVTGLHSAELYARAMQLKPIAYLLKPMNDALLLDAIGRARAAGTPSFPSPQLPGDTP